MACLVGRNEVRKALTAAVQRTNSSNNRVWSAFWAAHQRFFRQLWSVLDFASFLHAMCWIVCSHFVLDSVFTLYVRQCVHTLC